MFWQARELDSSHAKLCIPAGHLKGATAAGTRDCVERGDRYRKAFAPAAQSAGGHHRSPLNNASCVSAPQAQHTPTQSARVDVLFAGWPEPRRFFDWSDCFDLNERPFLLERLRDCKGQRLCENAVDSRFRRSLAPWSIRENVAWAHLRGRLSE